MIQLIGGLLYQWDVNREVEITSSEATHVQFANVGDMQAPSIELVNGKAKIPAYLLQTGKQICVYAVKDYVTIEKLLCPVRKRERPAEYVYEDDQRNYIYELINSAEEATKAANDVANELREAKENGEFNGPPGPQGEPGPAGPAGAGRLDVTRNGNKASHNAMEIYEHTEKGGQVFFEGMQLRYADGSIAIFRHDTTFSDLPYLFESIRIYENGNIEIFSGNLPYLDDDAVHHTSTWSSHKIEKELNAKAPLILLNSTPTKHTSGDYEGQLCVCIMGDEWSIPTAELYIYSGCRAFDDTSPLEHYWEKVGDGGGKGTEMLVANITHNEDGEISCDVDASQIRLALNSSNKAVRIVVNQQINGKRLFEPSVSVDLDGNISLYFADCRYEYDEITQSGWYYHSTVLPNGDEVSY